MTVWVLVWVGVMVEVGELVVVPVGVGVAAGAQPAKSTQSRVNLQAALSLDDMGLILPDIKNPCAGEEPSQGDCRSLFSATKLVFCLSQADSFRELLGRGLDLFFFAKRQDRPHQPCDHDAQLHTFPRCYGKGCTFLFGSFG